MFYTFAVDLHWGGEAQGVSFAFMNCLFKANVCYYVNEKHSLYFKFEDGTIMQAKCMDSKVAERYPLPSFMGYGGGWYIDMSYFLSADMLEKLSTNLVAKFRYETGEGSIEYDVEKKQAKVLQKQAVALMKRLKEINAKVENIFPDEGIQLKQDDAEEDSFQVDSVVMNVGKIFR